MLIKLHSQEGDRGKKKTRRREEEGGKERKREEEGRSVGALKTLVHFLQF